MNTKYCCYKTKRGLRDVVKGVVAFDVDGYREFTVQIDAYRFVNRKLREDREVWVVAVEEVDAYAMPGQRLGLA